MSGNRLLHLKKHKMCSNSSSFFHKKNYRITNESCVAVGLNKQTWNGSNKHPDSDQQFVDRSQHFCDPQIVVPTEQEAARRPPKPILHQCSQIQ